MKINATAILAIFISLMTVLVVVLTGVAIDKVKNLPQLMPLTPAADSLAAVNIIIPDAEPMVENAMVERPLFWKDRRPYVAEVIEDKELVPEVTGSDPFEKIKLVGVYSGGAILIVDGVKQRIRKDEDLAGWTLKMMSADGIVFTQGDEDKILQLEHATVAISKQKPKKNKKVEKTNSKKSSSDDTSIPVKEEQGEALQEKAVEAPPTPTKQENRKTRKKASNETLMTPQLEEMIRNRQNRSKR